MPVVNSCLDPKVIPLSLFPLSWIGWWIENMKFVRDMRLASDGKNATKRQTLEYGSHSTLPRLRYTTLH